MRSISRVTGASTHTIMKLLREAGAVCDRYHNMVVRNIESHRVQCDEIWSFCYAKRSNVPEAKSLHMGLVMFGHGRLWMPTLSFLLHG